jgi:hypothetical protein
MIPIFEQGQGKGIGHGLDSFLVRFDTICQEHVQNKRAKAFAFILYDFGSDLHRILKDQGIFARLDRLAGTNLSVFYLHTARRGTFDQFNAVFLSKLGVIEKANPPCVVFFKLKNNRFEDVLIAQLESADLIHGFDELSGVIQHYIEGEVAVALSGASALKFLKSCTQFIALETFRAALKKAIEIIVS